MSVNKVEMSLDDIIKANKGKAKTNKRGGVSQKATGSQKTPKRVVNRGNRISKFQQKGADKRVQNFKKNANNTRGRLQNLNTVATQKLVQKLVKKALAQSNVSRIVGRKPIGKSAIRKRGAVRYVKQPVVLNRVNLRSRVISRNQRFPNGRSVVRLASNQQFLPAISRVKYVTAIRPIIKRQQQQQRITYVRQPKRKQVQIVTRQQTRRPAFVQKQRPIIVQQQSPVGFRRNGAGGSRVGTSVRDQIAALRQQQQQVVYVQRPKPQVTYVQREVQPGRQSRGRNARFQGQRKPQQQRRPNRNNDPFYEPPNYLQRF